MSNPRDVEFCPTRANLHLSQVDFADFSSVQVANYSNVKYFQPSESENEAEIEEGGRCFRSPR
jgi:hypothetical protein